jgi:hypothetical protein
VNVLTTRAGEFISAFKIKPAQLKNVLERGSL